MTEWPGFAGAALLTALPLLTALNAAMGHLSLRKALVRVLIFVAVSIAIILLGIWFNLGPAVHSSAV
jgi:hypothetical protein